MSENKFHSHFQNILNTLVANAQQYFMHFADNELNSRATRRPITLKESMTVGASVRRDQDGHAAYSINAGAIAAILDISHSMAATKKFIGEVPLVGDVFEARRARVPADFLNYAYLLGDGQPIPLIPQVLVANDPQREALDALVRDLALRFLFVHEQAHFVGGHLHYIYGVDKSLVYDELPSQPAKLASKEDRRALELDADGSAYIGLLELHKDGSHLNLLGPLSEYFSSPVGWVRIVTVSSTIVMILLSIIDHLIPDSGTGTHPSAQARMLNILVAMDGYVRENIDTGDNVDLLNSRIEIFGDIKLVADFIGVDPPSYEAYAEWYTAGGDFKQTTCIELRYNLNKLTQLRELISNL